MQLSISKIITLAIPSKNGAGMNYLRAQYVPVTPPFSFPFFSGMGSLFFHEQPETVVQYGFQGIDPEDVYAFR